MILQVRDKKESNLPNNLRFVYLAIRDCSEYHEKKGKGSDREQDLQEYEKMTILKDLESLDREHDRYVADFKRGGSYSF